MMRICAHEAALAEILLRLEGQGDGESLDGLDPKVVVAAVMRRVSSRRNRKTRKPQPRALRPALATAVEERTAKVGAENLDFRRFVSRLACAIELVESPTGVDPCHRRGRRHGDWIVDAEGRTVGNIFPARRRYHNEQHAVGIETFAATHGRDLERICRVVGEGYLLGLEPEVLSVAAREAGGYEKVDLDSWMSRWSPAVRDV